MTTLSDREAMSENGEKAINAEMEAAAKAINDALKSSGYKREEAYANCWSKTTKQGTTIRRIYLNGKKASGFIHKEDGKWIRSNMSFSMLIDAVEVALSGLNDATREA
jgi:hypothetical protein